MDAKSNQDDTDEELQALKRKLEEPPTSTSTLSGIHNNLYLLYYARFQQSGKFEDIVSAIEHCQQALSLLPTTDDYDNQRAVLLSNLGNGLVTRWRERSVEGDLDEALNYQMASLELRPTGSSDRAISLTNLGTTFLCKFQLNGSIETLEEAIKYQQDGVSLQEDPNDRATSLTNVANSIMTRFSLRYQIADLSEAINLHQESLKLRPPGTTGRSSTLNNLALSLAVRFELFGKMEDLEEAIECNTEALQLHPDAGDPKRRAVLNNLAVVVRSRFEKRGRKEDLEDSIKYGREALAGQDVDDTGRSNGLNNLANALETRFELEGKPEDLDEALALHKEVHRLLPTESPNKGGSFNNLANAHKLRFDHQGNEDDLEEAIKLYREALLLISPENPIRALPLNNLGTCLWIRYERRSDIADLEESVKIHREALALRPAGNSGRSQSLDHLGVALSMRYKKIGEFSDLQDAIRFQREALSLRLQGHLERGKSLSNLASSLSTEFRQTGKEVLLDEVITLLREALAIQPVGNVDRGVTLGNLAMGLMMRFEHSGGLEVLDECIGFFREALLLTSPTGPHRASLLLAGLGKAFELRFFNVRNVEDLQKSVSTQRESLSLMDAGHVLYAASLDNLGSALKMRGEQLDNLEDLNESIKLREQALSLRPVGHSERTTSLNNTADAYWARFAKLGDVADLEVSIAYQQEALNLRSFGDSMRPKSLNNLANGLWSRFKRSGKIQDMNNAISHHTAALTIMAPNNPEYMRASGGLALIYAHRQEYDVAITFLKEASLHDAASIGGRLKLARYWASLSHQQNHESALEAYTKCFDLLDAYLTVAPDVEQQQAFLVQSSETLASNAAACALSRNLPEKAVELLERGRMLILSRLHGYRSSIDELRELDASLAQRLRDVGNQLEQLATSSEQHLVVNPEDRNDDPYGFSLRRQRELYTKWEESLKLIRQVEGMENFMQLVPFTKLRDAATEGPIVIVNVSSWRSDAVVVWQDATPTVISLPDTFYDDVKKRLEELAAAREKQKHDGNDAEYCKVLKATLIFLWEALVGPVTKIFTEKGVAIKSRIWWCPTSYLAFLPIHAAGPFAREQRNLPDLFISSYTPTLSTLITARQSMISTASEQPKLLAVGYNPGDLPKLQEELQELPAFSDRMTMKLLSQHESTKSSVLASLEHHNWAHFACHGHLNFKQPFRSYFQLHNHEQLSLISLIRANLTQAEFAFLSACHSAAGSSTVPDEGLSLAAALQFCGFRSVVGTLWAMDDEDGPMVAREFYTKMFESETTGAVFTNAARAINLTTRELRKKRIPIDRWVNYIHIGA